MSVRFTLEDLKGHEPAGFRCQRCQKIRRRYNRINSVALICLRCDPPRAGWYAKVGSQYQGPYARYVDADAVESR